MDFLDIQEMLMVIFNVSFKLNYISYIEWIRFSVSLGSVVIVMLVFMVLLYLSFTPGQPQYKLLPTLSSDRVLDNNNL